MNHYRCGLANLGNTCFLNSCIQILNCVDEIDRIVSHKVTGFISSQDLTAESDLINNWIELREFMVQPRDHHPIVVNPIKFVKSVHLLAQKKGRELFTGWAQNDLPEFLQFLVECAHNTRKRSIKMRINGTAENSTDNLALKCYEMLKTEYERGDYSEFAELFYGVYVSRLFTVGEDVSVPGYTKEQSPTRSPASIVPGIPESCKPELYCILDLPIPSNASSSIKLIDCFDLFINDELISGWRNEATGNIEPVKKNIVFWNFPRILMITLKRYSADGRRKNNALIDFPVDIPLDLSKYIIGYKASSYKYKLFGVANHMGGVNGGHYTSYIRPNDGAKWVCCNDTTVSEIDASMVVSESAYCLFYRKM